MKIRCPKCQKAFKVPDNTTGKKANCPCGTSFIIPSLSPAISKKADSNIEMQNKRPGKSSNISKNKTVHAVPPKIPQHLLEEL